MVSRNFVCAQMSASQSDNKFADMIGTRSKKRGLLEQCSSGEGVFWYRGLLEKGSFRKMFISRDSRGCRETRTPPECEKQMRIRRLSRDSLEKSREGRLVPGRKLMISE